MMIFGILQENPECVHRTVYFHYIISVQPFKAKWNG